MKYLYSIIIIIFVAIIETAIITPSVAYAYPDVNAKLFACTVFLNTSIVPLVFGIPLAIIMQEELGFKPYSTVTVDSGQ